MNIVANLFCRLEEPTRSLISMFTQPTKEFKVFWSIVRSLPVYVVDNFVRLKESPQGLFHNQSVFVNVFSLIWARVGVIKDEGVPAVLDPSTSPSWTLYSNSGFGVFPMKGQTLSTTVLSWFPTIGKLWYVGNFFTTQTKDVTHEANYTI